MIDYIDSIEMQINETSIKELNAGYDYDIITKTFFVFYFFSI